MRSLKSIWVLKSENTSKMVGFSKCKVCTHQKINLPLIEKPYLLCFGCFHKKLLLKQYLGQTLYLPKAVDLGFGYCWKSCSGSMKEEKSKLEKFKKLKQLLKKRNSYRVLLVGFVIKNLRNRPVIKLDAKNKKGLETLYEK